MTKQEAWSWALRTLSPAEREVVCEIHTPRKPEDRSARSMAWFYGHPPIANLLARQRRAAGLADD